MTTFPTPVVESCRSYYGVRVVDVGEDGDMLAMGHGLPPRRVLAALNAHARHLGASGGIELADTYEDAVGNLRESWMQLHTECCGSPLADPEKPDAPCPTCDDILPDGEKPYREYAWCGDWLAAADADGAFPVTVWQS